MAKKHKKPEIKRPLTKHELSRWEKQKNRQRIITVIGSAFLVIILGLVGFGYYNSQFKPLHQKVLKVNDTVFDMAYYLKTLELYAQGREASSSMVSVLASMVIGVIEQNELIKQAAPSTGISVSQQEITDMLKDLGLPNDEVARDIVEAELLTKKFDESYIDQIVPTTGEQAYIQAILVESKDVAQEVFNRLASGDNFTALADEFSVEVLTKGRSGDLGWLPKGYLGLLLWGENNPLFEQTAFSLQPQEISEPTYDNSIAKGIGYWIIQVVEKSEEQGIHLNGILLGSRQEAEEIRAKLEAGESFSDLAQSYSQHQQSKDNSGDLGWLRWSDKGQGLGTDALIEAGYQLETDAVSPPISDIAAQTQGGYWLIKVVDKDANRKLDDDARANMKAKAFQDWLDEQKKKSTIEQYLTEEQRDWAVAQVLKMQSRSTQTPPQR